MTRGHRAGPGFLWVSQRLMGRCGKPGTQALQSDLGKSASPGLTLQRQAGPIRCSVATQARAWPLGMMGT